MSFGIFNPCALNIVASMDDCTCKAGVLPSWCTNGGWTFFRSFVSCTQVWNLTQQQSSWCRSWQVLDIKWDYTGSLLFLTCKERRLGWQNQEIHSQKLDGAGSPRRDADMIVALIQLSGTGIQCCCAGANPLAIPGA